MSGRNAWLWLLPALLLLSVSRAGAQHAGHDHGAVASPQVDPTLSTANQAVQTASSWDWFTNFGTYFPKTHCLVRADGTPDWPWIIALIVLNVGVLAGYLQIYRFWHRSYYAELPTDRNPKLMYLALIFLLCAITGYAFSIVMTFWPAYRLQALFLAGLTVVTWAFAWNANDMRASFSAFRLQRELEQSLRNRAAELEKLVSERTAELESARQEAIAANEAKSRFVAHMSHEIRIPLTAMLGYATLLDEQDAELDPAQRREYVDVVRQSGQHLLGIINDVLDFSKIEAGHMEISPEPTDIPALVRECVALFVPRAQQRGNTIGVEMQSDLASPLMLDGMRLRQMLANLLGNAVKFTENGRISVVARYVPVDGHHELQLQVRDTGPGIPADKLRTLFQPFTQADASMSRRFGGTGLGLTICRRLAQLMGGSATASSVVGEGSVFTLQIPAATTSLGSQAPTTVKPRGLVSDALAGKRLLVAEDHPRLRQLTVLCLEKAGASVVTAANGEEALAAVAGQTFDLVLLDMQMPIKDGYSTASDLRTGGFTNPIVAFTAHAFESEKARCLQAGCSHVLTKPFEPGEIAHTLAGFIQQRDPVTA